MKYFTLADLTKIPPRYCDYSEKLVEEDMQVKGVSKWQDLSDYDYKYFENEAQALKWLEKYEAALESLKDPKLCLKKGIPWMLYKRRYMAQTLMGEKNQTYRDSKTVIKRMSVVKPGDLFNFSDQSYLLTVRLKAANKQKDGMVKYEFELP